MGVTPAAPAVLPPTPALAALLLGLACFAPKRAPPLLTAPCAAFAIPPAPLSGRLPPAFTAAPPARVAAAAVGDSFSSAAPSSASPSAGPASSGAAATRRDVLASSVAGAGVGLAAMSSPGSIPAADASDGGGGASPPAREKPSVGWGIVGLGDVTAVKSGPAFLKCPGSNLVAVMRRTPGKAAEWARSQDGPSSTIRAYDDLDRFLADPDLEAVYVCTPPGSHLGVCLRVAEARKACYVEKPAGRSGAETRAIAAAFEDRGGLPLFPAYVSRAYERTEAVRRLLREGAVGDRVSSVRYRLRGTGGARGMDADGGGDLPWRLRASASGGGLIMDVGCHVVDRIDYLCGPLVKVVGKAENRGSPWQDVEDYVSIRAEIGPSEGATVRSEGASVDLEWDFGPPAADGEEAPVDELIIEGPAGSLRMAAMSPSLPVDVLDRDGRIIETLAFDAPEHAAQALIQLVTDELRAVPGRQSPSRADNAVRTSEVLDEALGAYYGGRDDAFWDRPETWPGRPSRG